MILAHGRVYGQQISTDTASYFERYHPIYCTVSTNGLMSTGMDPQKPAI